MSILTIGNTISYINLNQNAPFFRTNSYAQRGSYSTQMISTNTRLNKAHYHYFFKVSDWGKHAAVLKDWWTSINYNNNHRSKSQVEIETLHFQTFPSKYVLVILSFLSFVLFNNGLSHTESHRVDSCEKKKLSGWIFSNFSTRTRDDNKPVLAIKSYWKVLRILTYLWIPQISDRSGLTCLHFN